MDNNKNFFLNIYNSLSSIFSNIYVIIIVVVVIGYIQSLIVSSMIDNKLTILENKGLIKPKININVDKHRKKFHLENTSEHFTNKSKKIFKQNVKRPKEHFTDEKVNKDKKKEENIEQFTNNKPKVNNFKPLEYKFPYQAYNNEDSCYSNLSINKKS